MVEPPPAVAHMAGVTCQQPRPNGNISCKTADLAIDVYLDGCSTDGFYGVIQTPEGGKTSLHESLPVSNDNTVARLQKDQFTCVSANARDPKDVEPTWFYVTAIPVSALKACKGNPDCVPGDLPIEWVKAHGGEPCHPGPDKRFVGDCAAGWVKASEFGEYSMGI